MNKPAKGGPSPAIPARAGIAALSQRHVQGPKYQFGANMVGHRPSHHPAAEHVEHYRQIHEPRQGRHLGDIGHLDAVRRLGLELAFDPVRRRTITRVHARGGHTPARPASRIRRATRLRLTGRPLAQSSAWPEAPRRSLRALVDGLDRAPTPSHDSNAHGFATRSIRWGRRPADGTSWSPDDGLVRLHELKTSPAPSRSPVRTRPRLFLRSPALREADVPLDEAAAAPRAPCSSYRPHDGPRRDRLSRTLEFSGQPPCRAASKDQFDHPAPVLRRVREMSFCHLNTSCEQSESVHRIGATPPRCPLAARGVGCGILTSI